MRSCSNNRNLLSFINYFVMALTRRKNTLVTDGECLRRECNIGGGEERSRKSEREIVKERKIGIDKVSKIFNNNCLH